MKITRDMINLEIRTVGTIIRHVFNFKNEESFRRVQWLLSKVKRFMKAEKLRVAEKTISTPDNYPLRILVVSAHTRKPDAFGLLWIHGDGYGIGALIQSPFSHNLEVNQRKSKGNVE